MTVVTIDGYMGSGGRDVGVELAKKLEFDYLDRWLLTETSQRLGATVEALVQKETLKGDINEKLSKILKNLLERSALVGAGDPSFGPGIEAILSEPDDSLKSPITDVHDLDDQQFINITKQVIKDFAKIGNSVIVGRGGSLILQDNPNTIHLLTVCDIKDRTSRIMSRHHMDNEETINYITEADQGRDRFFKKYFNCTPDESSNYGLVLNTSTISIDQAVRITEEYIKIYSK